ncbi:hypothetical protein [Fundidesulfovibrio agrisoli]|uniref:hypothetical protein n=1 Tax=Fundidesulfovibrio agrisoli TaxID=2922717 RepID=UPI001FAC9EB0|nr:hypothetical protein [Fundidesulfovibrio agrisoli]
MKRRDVLAALERATGRSDLQEYLGVTRQTMSNWKKSDRDLNAVEVAKIIKTAVAAKHISVCYTAIKPIVEFYPIDMAESRCGAKIEPLSTNTNKGVPTLYQEGLHDALSTRKGVYIFYDSRGRAIYAGKARDQFLWPEIVSVFNRDRKDTQELYYVNHPSTNVDFTVAAEYNRQIVKHHVKLCDVAAFFSAYEVDGHLIDDVESLLIRGFANDLLNKSMERFASVRDL